MRKHYLDNIRWMTVVLVVVYHMAYMYNGQGIAGVAGRISDQEFQAADLLQYVLYPWFMSLLFIVSGISARIALRRQTAREFLKSRTEKLLVPSTLGLFAFQFIQGYVNMALSGAFVWAKETPVWVKALIMLASGVGVLWYIQVLWLLCVVLLLIRKIEKDRLWKAAGRIGILPLVLMVLPAWVSAQVLNTPVVAVYRFGLYLFMFLAGYFVFSHEEVMEAVKKAFFPFLAVSLGLCAAFCIVYFGKNYADAPVNRSPLFVGFAWFTCLAVLGGMARYGNFENGFTRWMNRRSFGLYVFHYLGVSTAGLLIGRPRLLPAPLIYLVTLAAGFVFGYGLYALISRIPVYRFAVLGIRKKDGNA